MSDEPIQRSAAARDLRRAWRRGTVIAAAAMLVGGLLAGGFVAARYEAQMGQVRRDALAFRERLRQEGGVLRERAASDERIVDLLRDPATRVIALRGAGPSPAAQGRVIWHDKAGGHIFVTGLPPAPAGKVYALWAIRAGRPSPAGVLPLDPAGQGSVSLAPREGPVEAFVVTLEPAPAGPEPTGPVVLASR